MHTQLSIHTEPETPIIAAARQFDGFLTADLKIGDTNIVLFLRDEEQLETFRNAIANMKVIGKTAVRA